MNNYRSNMDNFVDLLNSERRDDLRQGLFDQVKNLSKGDWNLYSYSLSKTASCHLVEHGIPLHPQGCMPHPHPVCKTIETFLLHGVVRPLLKDFLSDGFNVKVCSMKESKFLGLKKRLKDFQKGSLTLFNKIYEPKDIIRYGSKWPQTSKLDGYCDYLSRTRTKNSVLFLHDEIHHFSVETLEKFLFLTKPKILVATAIFPVEILKGSKKSLNPHIYEFDIIKGKLLFYPDGKSCGHYEQISNWPILKMSGIKADVHYSIDVVRTIGAHHVLVFTRGARSVATKRAFNDFKCFNPTIDKNLFVRPCNIRMRSEALERFVMYMMSLKKPDVESAIAKLRQLSDDKIDPLELPFVMSAAKVLCEKNLNYSERFFETLRGWIDSFAQWNKFARAVIPNEAKQTAFKRMIDTSFRHNFIFDLKDRKCLNDVMKELRDDVSDFIDNAKFQGEKLVDQALPNSWRKAVDSKFFVAEEDEGYGTVRRVNPLCELEVKEEKGSVTLPEESVSETSSEVSDDTHDTSELCSPSTSGSPPSNSIRDLIPFTSSENHHEPFKRVGTRCWKYTLEIFNDARLCTFENLLSFPDQLKHGFAGFYAVDGISSYSYNGGHHNSIGWFPFLDDILRICGFEGHFNSCLAQIYDKDKLNFHKDDEDCYDPFHEVLTVNLRGTALFCTHGSRSKVAGVSGCSMGFLCSNSFDLKAGDFFLMPKGFQIDHKHAVRKIEAGRISLTFRLQKEDEGGEFSGKRVQRNCINLAEDRKSETFPPIKEVSEKEKMSSPKAACSKPTPESENEREVLRQNQDETGKINIIERFCVSENACLIHAIAQGLKEEPTSILKRLLAVDFIFWENWVLSDSGADEVSMYKICSDLNVSFTILGGSKELNFGDKETSPHFFLSSEFNHLKFERNSNEGGLLKKERDFGLFAFHEISKFDNATGLSISLSYKKASVLSKAFLQRKEGVISDKFFRKRFTEMKIFPEIEIGGLILCGLPGSGKSSCIEGFCKSFKDRKILVITPRSELKKQWENKLDIKAKGKVDCSKNDSKSLRIQVVTFEVALGYDTKGFELIILDECFLFPNGYLDLLFGLSSDFGRKILLLGDPLQSSHHSMSSEELREIPDLISSIKFQGNLNYKFFSFRLSESFGKLMPFACLGEKGLTQNFGKVFDGIESMINFSKGAEKPDIILVGSFDDKNLFPKSFRTPVMTFGEAQGLTVNVASILLTNSTFKSDNFRQFVAVTRAKKGISFINFTGRSLDAIKKSFSNSLLVKVLLGKISLEMIHSMFELRGISADSVNFLEPEKLQGNTAEDKLEGDPWLKPYLFLGQIPEAEICRYKEPLPEKPEFKTHLPLFPENMDFATIFEKMRAKEFREQRVRFDMSSQFIDAQREKGIPACQPMLFESIYPRHKGSDDVTFWMAVKKRLRFSKPEIEKEKYQSNFKYGAAMFENFKKFLPLDQEFEERFLNMAQFDFEMAKLKKDAATIKNHSLRSCKDWDNENVFLFMKSQLCTKLDKRFCDAKAGQTLACFNHLVLCHFSRWCRYIDFKVQKAIKAQKRFSFYIHTRKNFEQLNDWVLKQDFMGDCTESDYEAFDASQDSIVLAFEVCLMEYLRIPPDVIHAYKELKFHLRCKLGAFAVMRFTGEFCTFLFNTLSNMAFTFMRYEIKEGTSIAFAGDDMCASAKLRVSDEFEDVLSKLSLKAKVGFTKSPTFCGWYLTRFGIVKSPKLIWERFRVSMERDNLRDCLESYAIEACYAYDLGDRLFEILDEENLLYYQAINRLVVKKLDQISPNIKKLFSRAFANLRHGDRPGEQNHQGIQEFWESDGSDSCGLNLP